MEFVIKFDSEASDICAYIKDLASEGWIDFHSARRKAGITDSEWERMGSFESEEFQNAHQAGIDEYNKEN
jgi:hypothetical protein